MHWNGKAWKQVPSPAPASGSLSGVAAVSARRAWVVGFGGTTDRVLIERWDGTAWKQVPSPVAAMSGSNAWAVGSAAGKTLTERWNGIAWK